MARVLLVQPPQSDPAQPYSSLAVLLSAWRRAGHEVDVLDLNLAFYEHLVAPESLVAALEEVEARLGAPGTSGERVILEQAATTADWLVPLTQRAIATLKDPERFYDPEHYAWAIRLLKRTLGVHSATVYPGAIGLQSFDGGQSYLSSRGIAEAARNPRTNLFLRHIDAFARSRIAALAPEVVAVSVTFQTQLIPAFTLAAKVREWFPGVRVVFGGATISRVRDALHRAPTLFENVDAFVLFEGETAFPALLEEWEAGRSGLAAPNVMARDGGEIRSSTLIHTEDLDALGAPDHRGLPLDAYWVPHPALLLNSSRGCYYGRCTFCMISPATWGPVRMGKSYRIRSSEKVVADMAAVKAQTGATAFNLANDILPPRALAEIGAGAVGLGVTWDSEIRLERGLTDSVLQQMYDGGCRHLRFGFESAAPRIAKLMDKGTDVQITRRILTDCRQIGITVSLLTQVGFPGETQEEADQTADFLAAHADRIAFLSLTQFVLETGSGVHQNPGHFGVTLLDNPPDEDLSWMYFYTVADGTSSADANVRYERMETRLDEHFPDRDLFFKGGLGHAHTTLYTAAWPPAVFDEWNRTGVRRTAVATNDRTPLRTARDLTILRRVAGRANAWGEYTVSAGEAPEYTVRIDGGLLPLFVAAIDPMPRRSVTTLLEHLSGGTLGTADAAGVIDDLLRAGLLVPELAGAPAAR